MISPTQISAPACRQHCLQFSDLCYPKPDEHQTPVNCGFRTCRRTKALPSMVHRTKLHFFLPEFTHSNHYNIVQGSANTALRSCAALHLILFLNARVHVSSVTRRESLPKPTRSHLPARSSFSKHCCSFDALTDHFCRASTALKGFHGPLLLQNCTYCNITHVPHRKVH